MSKTLPFFRRYGLLLFPLIVIGLGIDAQIYIYQRFGELHVPEASLLHLLFLSFGPFIFFYESERMRFRQTFNLWKRVYWALYIGLATFYALAFIGAALL